jgi:hypothetical protein
MAKKDILLIGIIVVVLAALTYLIYDQVFTDEGTTDELVSNTLQDEYEEEDTYDYDEPYESEDDVNFDEEDSAADELIADVLESDEEEVIEPEDYEEDSFDSDLGNTEGKYMVMAGQFRQMKWAEEQQRLMIKKGYVNSKIEIFDRGAWANVLVDRFDSNAEAEALVAELTDKGVEATIIIKQN